MDLKNKMIKINSKRVMLVQTTKKAIKGLVYTAISQLGN